MEVEDETSPVPVDPAPPERLTSPVNAQRRSRNQSINTSGSSTRAIFEGDNSDHDDSLDVSGLADGESQELLDLVQPSDTSIISEPSNCSNKAEPALSRDGKNKARKKKKKMPTKSDVVTRKRKLTKQKKDPVDPGPRPVRKSRRRKSKALKQADPKENARRAAQPGPEEQEQEDDEHEPEEPESSRKERVDWWNKTEEELDVDFKELEAWVEAGGDVEMSKNECEELRAIVHHFYPFPLSTLDEPMEKFTAEDQMVPWEEAEPRFEGTLENPPTHMLKLNLRVTSTPNPACSREDIEKLKPIAPMSSNYNLRTLLINPGMDIRLFIKEIRSRFKLDPKTLDVFVFSKGRLLDKRTTMREAVKQQEDEESLEEEHGKFFLDVQIFERFERPPLIMQTGTNTYRLVRRRARSAPLEEPPRKKRMRVSNSQDDVEKVQNEEEGSVDQSEHGPQMEDLHVEDGVEEEIVSLKPAATSTIPPTVPSGSAEPVEDDDDDEEMPALSAEEPMQTEEVPQQIEPNPVQPPNGFHYQQHQNYQEYRQMLREKERIRRRGPRAPKENVSTTYHDLTPPVPKYPNGYPIRPPVSAPSFRFEGPIPFDAKVNVLCTEFKKTKEEIRRMTLEEVDRLFNQIATSHIAKNQQLHHQQQQIMHAQKMQMRQNPGTARPPLPLPVRIGSFPPGHPGNRPNIRLPPGAPAGLINRLVPVMMPMAPGQAPTGPLPPQMVQQMIAQHQAAAMAARYVQKQKEVAARAGSSSQPSTSTAPVAPVKDKSSEKTVIPKETPVEGAETTTRAEKRKRAPVSRKPPFYLGPSADTEVRNHFVSITSPYYPPEALMPWMHHPVNRGGAINVPNTICALTEFIELCGAQNADPSRFLESYYLADQCPKYRSMLNTNDYNMHVTRRRCDLGDVRIPRLDAEQQLRLYLMRFEADEQNDAKWREFYQMMEWPLPPDGRFPKGKKIEAPGHLSVNLTPRVPRVKTAQPMKQEEKDILERAIATARAGQLAEKKGPKEKEKSPEREQSASKRNSIQSDPEDTVPNAEFLQSLAPSLHRDESPEIFGEEEHSQTSSDVTSDGVRPSSNTSSNAQDDVTNNAGSGEKVQSSSTLVVSEN